MGSTGLRREAGLTDLEFFTQQWPDALGEGGYWTVLAHNSDRQGFYAAIRDSRFEKPSDQHFILVVKKDWFPRAYDNFVYKDMTDTMGPGIDGASLDVLDAVPETDHEYAKPWRERCLTLRMQEADIKRNLKHGSTIKFPRTINYADGVTEDTFTANKPSNGGRYVFRRATDNRPVRMPADWKKTLGVTVTAPAS